MDEIEAIFGILSTQDSGDEKSIGYGIIADTSTPGMDNPQSIIFFDAIFKRQHLGLQSDQDGRILFNKELALQWINNIDDAMRQFFPISHNHFRPWNGGRVPQTCKQQYWPAKCRF